MNSRFQNPRNPLAAMWASAVEHYLRGKHPELNIQQIRQLPMMLGAYAHLSQLKQKLQVSRPPAKPSAGETDQDLKVAQMAYLSQTFFNFALTAAAFYTSGSVMYESYIALLEDYNRTHNKADFSSDDLAGFALCVIVWVGLVGLTDLSKNERSFLNYLINLLPLSTGQKQEINDFWDTIPTYGYTFQYRNPKAYPNYQAIPWTVPAGAQIVILGDWGTALEDAHQFLYAIWKKAHQNSSKGTVVFLHLGDIYYCGLPYECQDYFHNVFVNVGQQLQADINDSNFNPNPPIFTLPGNHEYYSYGYGYFQLLDTLNKNVPNIAAKLSQQCSFFCLRTEDNRWQFLGMDTGQADGNALLAALEGLGDLAKDWFNTNLPEWGWVQWLSHLAQNTYDDFVGPFQPTLNNDELNWLKEKLDHFPGKTIMLSHHQLFTRQAKINHNNPVYLNTWLDKNFSYYFTNKIAAWYWGHEHSFALYMDGLWGLNKGRLLGSSSYEATLGKDGPYVNNHPMVPFAPNMEEKLIQQNKNGLYHHVGAILHQKDSVMKAKYYQFPAWTQLDPVPNSPKLEEITEVAEEITTSFTSLKPSWIGNQVISENNVTTDKSPAITSWNDMLYMLYNDGDNLKVCTANTADYRPENSKSVPDWSSPANVKVNNNSLKTRNSPAVIAVDAHVYGFYIDGGGYIQGIVAPVTGSRPENWTSIGKMPNQVGDAAPSVCFFQGRIYIVYRQSGSNKHLGWACYDVVAKTWTDFGKLFPDGTDYGTSYTPGLATDAYHIYMAYQGDGTDIGWAVGTPSGAPSGTNNNIKWKDKGKLWTSAKEETTNPDTKIGLTLQYAAGVFLLVYTSTNNSLTQCALNGTDANDTGSWIGSNTVKVIVNGSGNRATASSICAPALAITSVGGFLVYRGKEKDEIHWAYY